jgi:hypothetical protein
VADLDAGNPGTPPVVTNPPSAAVSLPPDIVAGNLIQFNDNGNWTWYSDERSIVDKAGGKIIVGSDGNGAGMGGSARKGAIAAAEFDLESGTLKTFTLHRIASARHAHQHLSRLHQQRHEFQNRRDSGGQQLERHKCTALLRFPVGVLPWHGDAAGHDQLSLLG